MGAYSHLLEWGANIFSMRYWGGGDLFFPFLFCFGFFFSPHPTLSPASVERGSFSKHFANQPNPPPSFVAWAGIYTQLYLPKPLNIKSKLVCL